MVHSLIQSTLNSPLKSTSEQSQLFELRGAKKTIKFFSEIKYM